MAYFNLHAGMDDIPLPVENGRINVEKYGAMIQKEAQAAMKRIEEIDDQVGKAYAEAAVRIFGISKEEYLFLHRQSEVDSNTLSQYFRSGRRTALNVVEEADRYFENAHKAILAGEYWFGREESLLARDKAVYDMMNQKIAVELATTEEGKKIFALQDEKRMLQESFKLQQPFYEYLVERRQWWRYYPEYQSLVEQLQTEKAATP